MAHLKTFSRLHHGRFSEYDKGLTAGQAYIINDNGIERQIEIDDLYNPDLNFHFSDQTVPRLINGVEILGGRRISFDPKTLNTSQEFLENIPVDLTGCSVSPKIFDTKAYSAQVWKFYDTGDTNQFSEYNHENRSGVFNFDNYNSFLRWTSILISPRHVLMCGHCYSQLCSPTDFDNQLSKLFYINSQFLGKNNVYYRGFQNLQQAIDLGASGNLRFLRCGTASIGSSSCPTCEDIPRPQSFILLELPNDTWLDTSQVKVYNKIAVNRFVPTGYPIYMLRGGGHVVVPRLYPNYSYTDTINDSTNSVWTGDSHSPVLLNYLNETILGPRVQSEEIFFDEDIIDYMNEFMAPTGYQLEKIYIGAPDETPPGNYGNDTSFFTLNYDTLLGKPEYGSRFKTNELIGKKIQNIGFIPGVQLQASELNEIQDNFTKQYTIFNSMLSDMIITHIKQPTTTLFQKMNDYLNSILYMKKYLTLSNQNLYILNGPIAYRKIDNLIYYENFVLNELLPSNPNIVRYLLDTTGNNNLYYKDELTFLLGDSANRIEISFSANIYAFNQEIYNFTASIINASGIYTLENELIQTF